MDIEQVIIPHKTVPAT